MTCREVVIVCLCVATIIGSGGVYADTVKLKNGNSFEGRIVDDNGVAVKVKMDVGIVDFNKSDIAEIIQAPEEENAQLESGWSGRTETAGNTKSAEAEKKPTESELVDAYLNKGKVKYQGRWISKDVYDVIMRENEIKEKRYRFMQQKGKTTAAAGTEEKVYKSITIGVGQPSQSLSGTSSSYDGLQSLKDRFKPLGTRSFGEQGTRVIATEANDTLNETSNDSPNDQTLLRGGKRITKVSEYSTSAGKTTTESTT